MTERLEIHSLGGLRIVRDGRPVAGIGSRKAEALFLYLACSRRPQPREVLADLFWDERTSGQALANLRWLLTRLRQTLGPYMIITHTSAAMDPAAGVSLDVLDFEDTLQQARAAQPRGDSLSPHAVKLLEQAMSLYAGPFLQGFFVRTAQGFEEWAIREQERVHHLAALCLDDLVTYYMERKDYQAGIQRAAWLLQLDPLHEKTHRKLMEMLARSGQRGAALQRYDTYRRTFASELGYASPDALDELYKLISTAGESPKGPVEGRSSVYPTHPRTPTLHLPLSLTPFVGRERDLAELERLLADPYCRLLTLVGPGGAGKTRLAIEAAQVASGPGRSSDSKSFSDGLYFVPLDAVSEPEFMVSAITDALQIRLPAAGNLFEQLIDHLRDKDLLLVLDNFEHLLSGADFLVELLSRAPGVSLLVTSRQPLDLAAEQIYDVAGLEAPSAAVTEPATIETYDAVQLFVQRARRVLSHFDLSPTDAYHVARICRAVDGLPLAIELAAIWVRTHTCEEIEGLLEKGIDLLATTRRDVPDRHRSLRAVFDRTWSLLTAEEGRALARMSVFRGGFEYEAALRVAAADRELLTKLADRSLIRQTPGGRYDMHEMMRQYAAARLDEEPGEREKAQAEHATFYAGLAEAAHTELVGTHQLVWLARLEQEHDNIRAALSRLLACQDSLVALRMSRAMQRFWYFRGYLREGADWIKAALALPTAQVDLNPATRELALARARAANAAGVLCQDMAEREQAEIYVSESVALFRELGETMLLASPLNNLGLLARDGGDLDRAHSLLAESLALYRELGDRHDTAVVLNNLGKVMLLMGDLPQARSHLEESLALFEQLGETRGMALAQVNLGQIARNECDYPRALALFQSALKRYHEVGDKRGQAECLEGIAEVATSQFLDGPGPDRAEAWQKVAVILGVAAALRSASGARLTDFDRRNLEQTTAAVEAQITTNLWQDAWAMGRSLTEEQMLVYALDICF